MGEVSDWCQQLSVVQVGDEGEPVSKSSLLSVKALPCKREVLRMLNVQCGISVRHRFQSKSLILTFPYPAKVSSLFL